MVLLFPLLRDALGRGGLLWAALFTAVSAPFVFYSRYFIQEPALAAFTLALIACGWRYHVSRRLGWLLGASLSAGLIIATKETAVLTFTALGLGWLAALTAPRPPREDGSSTGGNERLRLALALVLALVVAFVVLSGFFSHVEGPLSYYRTFTPWLRRAGGTEIHRHPWHYYLSLLAWQHPKGGPVWTELFILVLAAAGGAATTSRETLARIGVAAGFARFALVYSVALAGMYSAIPYKTPWNLLSFHLGFILLAGLGAAALLSLLRPTPARAAVPVLLLAGAGHLAWQSQRTTFHYRDDNTGPYAYAQPQRGVVEIEARINELAAFSPRKDETVAQVVFADDYHWPLPWYLRRLKHVGYWTGKVPDEAEARLTRTPIILSSSDFDEELTARLSASHFMIGFSSLRPGVLVQTWVKNDLWEPFVMSKPRPPEPAAEN
jgi:uncharacterized protein (TIGR03663 family)